ncbi:MAG: fibrillarin-like rRNA/tRNA 2'-O-methyltransferase [Candidatus Thermoplasmatota archaeon]|nr:fibrillarin-like rRNA/tRNA 2'-O-methyltransferase [Candidatus Thermoplasmatota archaeon]MBS3789291.1 fibrillarin-like rRNA/tRNA 2'-O-methyltransferase [Candidatus Thermoplasmatota archaeon]
MKPVDVGIYEKDGKYYTLNLIPGQDVYGEELVEEEGFEYREWDPNRSKLCAFLEKEGSIPIQPDMDILYLGAGDGTTASHMSDIVTEGKIFALEVAREPFRNLLSLSKDRRNIFSIMADARNPERYEEIVGKVDFIYQDISQKDQTEIFLKNLRFLKEDSIAIIVVKAKSMDVSRSPEQIYEEVEDKLGKEGYDILLKTDISHRQKDHAMIVIEK